MFSADLTDLLTAQLKELHNRYSLLSSQTKQLRELLAKLQVEAPNETAQFGEPCPDGLKSAGAVKEPVSPRRCTICSHPEREAIEARQRSGESLRAIAEQFNVSKDAIARHIRNHLSEPQQTEADPTPDEESTCVVQGESRFAWVTRMREEAGIVL